MQVADAGRLDVADVLQPLPHGELRQVVADDVALFLDRQRGAADFRLQALHIPFFAGQQYWRTHQIGNQGGADAGELEPVG